MATYTFYLDSTTNPANPIGQLTQYTPFGIHQATETDAYLHMQWVTPNPSVFAFTGKDTCPMNNQCGQSRALIKQAHAHHMQQRSRRASALTSPVC
jgi:hypothetical protein